VVDTVSAAGDGLDYLKGVSMVLLPKDGSRMYAVADSSGAVSVFDRNAITGAIAGISVLQDQAGVLQGACAAALSDDGRALYVVARDANALVRYEVDVPTVEAH